MRLPTLRDVPLSSAAALCPNGFRLGRATGHNRNARHTTDFISSPPQAANSRGGACPSALRVHKAPSGSPALPPDQVRGLRRARAKGSQGSGFGVIIVPGRRRALLSRASRRRRLLFRSQFGILPRTKRGDRPEAGERASSLPSRTRARSSRLGTLFATAASRRETDDFHRPGAARFA